MSKLVLCVHYSMAVEEDLRKAHYDRAIENGALHSEYGERYANGYCKEVESVEEGVRTALDGPTQSFFIEARVEKQKLGTGPKEVRGFVVDNISYHSHPSEDFPQWNENSPYRLERHGYVWNGSRRVLEQDPVAKVYLSSTGEVISVGEEAILLSPD